MIYCHFVIIGYNFKRLVHILCLDVIRIEHRNYHDHCFTTLGVRISHESYGTKEFVQ